MSGRHIEWILPKHKIASGSLRAACNDPSLDPCLNMFNMVYTLSVQGHYMHLHAIVFELLLAPASAALAPSWQQVPLTVPGSPSRPHQSKTFNMN